MPRQIATTTDVDRAAMLDFVRPRHSMVLMTQRADGRPQRLDAAALRTLIAHEAAQDPAAQDK